MSDRCPVCGIETYPEPLAGDRRREPMTAADEIRKTLREDGWADGSLAFVQLDRALVEAPRGAAPRAEGLPPACTRCNTFMSDPPDPCPATGNRQPCVAAPRAEGLDAAIERLVAVIDNDEGAAEMWEAADALRMIWLSPQERRDTETAPEDVS